MSSCQFKLMRLSVLSAERLISLFLSTRSFHSSTSTSMSRTMETTTKKPRLETNATRHGVPSLPRPVVDKVLDYLLPVRATEPKRSFTVFSTPAELRILTKVDVAWETLFKEIASERELRELTISRLTETRSGVMQLRHELILRRTYVQRLTLDCTAREYLANMWAPLFSHAPRLTQLDLGRLSMCQPRLILDVCSRFCPLMQSVNLPKYDAVPGCRHITSPRMNEVNSEAWRYSFSVTNALVCAMKAWSESGRLGGLRNLSFCLNEYATGVRVVPEVVRHVITHCPNLERWSLSDGSVQKSSEDLLCDEQWLLDIKTWTSFCETFVRLTEFNWTCVPFATRFFEIFGQFSKPKLTKLWLATPENWNWDYYHSKVDEETKAELEQTGFGPSAKNAKALLRACPRLRELKVLWSVPYQAYDTPPKMMDPEVFGDEFCLALSEFCPYLERLEIDSVSCNVSTISSFTDKSLVALSQLPRLQNIKLKRVGITGDGLFELFANHQADNQHVREYEIWLGDNSRTTSMTKFYRTLHKFLKRLATHKATLPSASRRVSLHLKNCYGRALPESSSIDFYRELLKLVKSIRERHPYIKMRGLLIEQSDDMFKEVREFTLSMGDVADRAWERPRYDRNLVESQLDDVFTNRSPPPPRVREPWEELASAMFGFSSPDDSGSDDDQQLEPW